MKTIIELIQKCKNSVTIEVNNHRDCCLSVMQEIEGDIDDIEKDIVAKMIESDTVIRIQFYPDTAIGFYVVYHYDLESAIKECLEIISN